jgi:hypothetical protein
MTEGHTTKGILERDPAYHPRDIVLRHRVTFRMLERIVWTGIVEVLSRYTVRKSKGPPTYR